MSNQDQGQTVQMGGGHCHPTVNAVQHQPSVSSGGGQQPVQTSGGQVPQKQRSDRIEVSMNTLIPIETLLVSSTSAKKQFIEGIY